MPIGDVKSLVFAEPLFSSPRPWWLGGQREVSALKTRPGDRAIVQ